MGGGAGEERGHYWTQQNTMRGEGEKNGGRQVEDDHENVWRKQSLYFDLRLSRT